MSKIGYLRDKQPLMHRFGPDGEELDEAEASNWFPHLDETPHPVVSLSNGCQVELRYRGMCFHVHDVKPSPREHGVYFGDIHERLPENGECLGEGQNIGFELHHVFSVTAWAETRPHRGGVSRVYVKNQVTPAHPHSQKESFLRKFVT
jgi:hypothetical protein